MTKLQRSQVEEYYRKQAEEIAREYWDVEMTCPIVWVNREWKRMNACFRVWRDTDKCEIRLNHGVRDEMGDDEYLPILKHEMAHWYLWSTGQPYGDGDPEFVRECLRIGGALSATKKAQRAHERVREEAELIGG